MEEIIEGCKNDDRKYQEVLFNRFKSLFMGIAMRYMGDREAAKDVVQLSFIKIFEQIGSLKNPRAFEAWSRRIAVNTSLNELKKRGPHHPEMESLDETELPPKSDLQVDMIRKMEAEYLLELVATLPEGYRAVFNLYLVDGYSHAEVGSLLGISESTSRSQLAKARKYLRQRLEEMQIGEYGETYGR